MSQAIFMIVIIIYKEGHAIGSITLSIDDLFSGRSSAMKSGKMDQEKRRQK
jgi:hypothetical protein